MRYSDQPTCFEGRVGEATLATEVHLDIGAVDGGSRGSITGTVDSGTV